MHALKVISAFLFGFLIGHIAFAQEAEPIAVAAHPTGGDQIELFNVQGVCPEGTKFSLYLIGDTNRNSGPRGRRIPGCWVHRGGVIYTLFDDGDRIRLPVDAFVWKNSKPMKHGAM